MVHGPLEKLHGCLELWNNWKKKAIFAYSKFLFSFKPSDHKYQVCTLHLLLICLFFFETVYLLRLLMKTAKKHSGHHSANVSSGLLPSISKNVLSLLVNSLIRFQKVGGKKRLFSS